MKIQCLNSLLVGFVFFIFLPSLSAQRDLFDWEVSKVEMPKPNVSEGSGYAVDIFSRLFYVEKFSKRVYWKYGILLPNAIPARATSNIEYINDPVIGDAIFYIGYDGSINTIQHQNTTGQWIFDNVFFNNYHKVNSQSTILAVNRNTVLFVHQTINSIF